MEMNFVLFDEAVSYSKLTFWEFLNKPLSQTFCNFNLE